MSPLATQQNVTVHEHNTCFNFKTTATIMHLSSKTEKAVKVLI